MYTGIIYDLVRFCALFDIFILSVVNTDFRLFAISPFVTNRRDLFFPSFLYSFQYFFVFFSLAILFFNVFFCVSRRFTCTFFGLCCLLHSISDCVMVYTQLRITLRLFNSMQTTLETKFKYQSTILSLSKD